MNQRLKVLINELKRQRKIYSQADFADIVGIGQSQFSELVTGKRKLSERNIHKIASALPEINETWLLTGEGEMLKNSSSASDHSVSLAGDDIRENTIHVNGDKTIEMLVAELSAQRRLTEKLVDQNGEILLQNRELLEMVKNK